MLGITPKKVADKPEGLGNKQSSQQCKRQPHSSCWRVSPSLLPSRVLISSRHLTAVYKDNHPLWSPFYEGKRQSALPNLLQGQVRWGIRPSETDFIKSQRELAPIQICTNIHRCPVWSQVSLPWPQDRRTDKEAFPAQHFILASSTWPVLHHYSSDILQLN